MLISDYPVPRYNTGIGFHAGANGAFPLGEHSSDWQLWVDRIKGMGGSWVKLLAFGTSALDVSRFLLERDIMPIVRLYRGGPNPGSMVDDDPNGRDSIVQYVAAGVRYFEVNNESNLFSEWAGDLNHEGVPYSWQDVNPNQPNPVADSWVKDAIWVLDRGGYPGIPAMAPGGNIDDQDFLARFFDRVISTGNAGIMGRGVWISCHPAGFNHPINYPFDDVNQNGTPVSRGEYDQHQWRGSIDYVNGERARGKNPGMGIMDPGASNAWNKWRMVEQLFEQKFGFKVPVLATEGGFWMDEGQDPRYFVLNQWDVSYQTRTVCEEIMNGKYPDWYFCTGFWLLADKGMGGSGQFEHQAMFTLRAGDSGQWPVVGNLGEMDIHERIPYDEPAPLDPPPPNQLSDVEIADMCWDSGFESSALTTMVAIILAESGGDASAYNDYGNTPPDSVDRGLIQINSAAHPEVTIEQAYDPVWSCDYAWTLSRGGTYWGHWVAYNTGAYLNYWDRALAVTTDEWPSEEELKAFAYEDCLGVPAESALMREGRSLGLVPLSIEGRDAIGDMVFVGQVFGAGSRMVLLYCVDKIWDTVYQQEL